MRISFDLDETLISHQPGSPREPRLPWYLRLIARDEPLRLGARDLMRRLQDQGWDVWIYTTSDRSPASVRRWLRCHGLHVGEVINKQVHAARKMPTLRAYGPRPPSKNPAAFGIALHVDDSEGVRIEGTAHGFEVVVIAPDDEAWVEKVWRAAEAWRDRRAPA